MQIDGKVVLVTGAGQGIGRAIALRLAHDGADLALVDLKDDQTKTVADEVRKLGRKVTTFKPMSRTAIRFMPQWITLNSSSADSM